MDKSIIDTNWWPKINCWCRSSKHRWNMSLFANLSIKIKWERTSLRKSNKKSKIRYFICHLYVLLQVKILTIVKCLVTTKIKIAGLKFNQPKILTSMQMSICFLNIRKMWLNYQNIPVIIHKVLWNKIKLRRIEIWSVSKRVFWYKYKIKYQFIYTFLQTKIKIN